MINGGEEETMSYLKVGKMTIREEEIFRQIFDSDASRGGDNTSHDRSTFTWVENS